MSAELITTCKGCGTQWSEWIDLLAATTLQGIQPVDEDDLVLLNHQCGHDGAEYTLGVWWSALPEWVRDHVNTVRVLDLHRQLSPEIAGVGRG